jgi:hypothetical protein
MANDPPRRPIGRALRRTAAERERLAAVTDADIVNGIILAHETMPYPYGAMIDAKVSRREAE